VFSIRKSLHPYSAVKPLPETGEAEITYRGLIAGCRQIGQRTPIKRVGGGIDAIYEIGYADE
jgi:hypothetical protein